MAVAVGPAGLIVAYLATYFAHGATAPVHYGMVHRAVESSHRATVVSANSLTSQLGGALSGIALGVLADATSLSTAMAVAAVVLASAGPLYLVGRQADPVEARRCSTPSDRDSDRRRARALVPGTFHPPVQPHPRTVAKCVVPGTFTYRFVLGRGRVGGADAEGSYA